MRRAAFLLALAVACNPYDPNLGDQPFLCGSDEPRCPEGYVGVEISAIRCECRRAEDVMDGGVTYECGPDEQERNDSLNEARDTLIIDGGNMQANYPLASICPADDEDYFKLLVSRRGSIIHVQTMFDLERRPPEILILNADGQNLNAPTGTLTPGILVTTHPQAAQGMYFVRLRGSESVNYNVRITLMVPGLP